MVMSATARIAVPFNTDYELSVYKLSTHIQIIGQEEDKTLKGRFSAIRRAPASPGDDLVTLSEV